jgi:hypothetical protein
MRLATPVRCGLVVGAALSFAFVAPDVDRIPDPTVSAASALEVPSNQTPSTAALQLPATAGCADNPDGFWSPISTTGAPEASSTPEGFWTGQEVLVWGGTPATSGRYDPGKDTWFPVSPHGAPTMRYGAQHFWTGDRLLVWGGYRSAGPHPRAPTIYLNDGALYDPKTDSWTPATTEGAPITGSRSAAVWTGQEMVVWSEALEVLGVNDVVLTITFEGRYDPARNMWTAMSSTHNIENLRGIRGRMWTGVSAGMKMTQ